MSVMPIKRIEPLWEREREAPKKEVEGEAKGGGERIESISHLGFSEREGEGEREREREKIYTRPFPDTASVDPSPDTDIAEAI